MRVMEFSAVIQRIIKKLIVDKAQYISQNAYQIIKDIDPSTQIILLKDGRKFKILIVEI